MDRQSRGWGFESPVQPFNFLMLTEFVLISFIKPEVGKTLNIYCSNLGKFSAAAQKVEALYRTVEISKTSKS